MEQTFAKNEWWGEGVCVQYMNTTTLLKRVIPEDIVR
jgi:hypothetical protein